MVFARVVAAEAADDEGLIDFADDRFARNEAVGVDQRGLNDAAKKPNSAACQNLAPRNIIRAQLSQTSHPNCPLALITALFSPQSCHPFSRQWPACCSRFLVFAGLLGRSPRSKCPLASFSTLPW